MCSFSLCSHLRERRAPWQTPARGSGPACAACGQLLYLNALRKAGPSAPRRALVARAKHSTAVSSAGWKKPWSVLCLWARTVKCGFWRAMGCRFGFPTGFQLRVELHRPWELRSVSGSGAASGFPKAQESISSCAPRRLRCCPWRERVMGLVSHLLTWLQV